MPSSSNVNGSWPEEFSEDTQTDGRDIRESVPRQESSDEIRRRELVQQSEGAAESPMILPPLDPVFSSQLDGFRTEGSRMEQKCIPAKKADKEKKWRWKKPKDRPKRPLSAYNIFFQHERQTLRDVRMLPYADHADGTLGFAGLAKHVSTKWKNLDQGSKLAYEKLAAVAKEKYFVSLDQWKKEKEEKETTEGTYKLTSTEVSKTEADIAVSTASPVKSEPAVMQQSPNNEEAENYATASAMQHQQNMIMAQMVLSHQMSSMPAVIVNQYTMAAAMQEQAAMLALQNSYLSLYPRSMSMPMGMELQASTKSEPVVPKIPRSMSMPMGAVPANWSSSHEAEHENTHELNGDGKLVQVDTVSELPRFSSRRLSMPMTGTDTRVSPSIKLSRRSASMPLVNMEYTSNHPVDQEYYASPEFNAGYSSSNYLDQHHSHLHDAFRGNEHPDGVIISRRLSMPVNTADSSSPTAVMVQRRSSSMPMVNMEYFTNANTNVTHNTNSDVCDQLSAGYDGAASNHLAEGDDMVRDGVIYSRRMSMPAAMPTPTMVPSQYSGVTVSRRSMSMPMINTHEQQRLQQQQHDDGMGGAMDMNMEDEFDDLLSQLRGSG